MRYVGPRQVVIDDMPAPVPCWDLDRRYAGLTVVLVGGGPSHAVASLRALRHHCLIAINSACRRVRPIATAHDMLFFSDNSWAENRPFLLDDWPGPVVTSNRNTKARLGDAVHRIDITALTLAIGAAPDFVQASSGHTAACLAAIMGARRIVLTGFECRMVDGRSHGHHDYADHDTNHYRERFLPGWAVLAPVLAGMGVQVLNASPESAIPDFPIVPLAEALA